MHKLQFFCFEGRGGGGSKRLGSGLGGFAGFRVLQGF